MLFPVEIIFLCKTAASMIALDMFCTLESMLYVGCSFELVSNRESATCIYVYAWGRTQF